MQSMKHHKMWTDSACDSQPLAASGNHDHNISVAVAFRGVLRWGINGGIWARVDECC